MRGRSLAGATVVAVLASSCGGEGTVDEPPIEDVDAGTEPPPGAGERVFDTSVLHEIRIDVDPVDIGALETDHENRVPCTFTFDGTVLHDVGVRQKGQGSSAGSLFSKPSLSVKFDELVPGQELDGLDKLILQNAISDPTLMHEALGYGLYRRAGLPAPRAAHAVVTISGLPEGERVYGVHVIVEAVNKDFLRRAYGDAFGDGNLYEDDARGDFGTGPLLIDLKDEMEGRSRDHLVELAGILADAPANELVALLEPHLDLDVALTGFAIDVVSGNWDGFWFAAHNYYLYDNPRDGRFVLMPHGMDLLFDGPCGEIENTSSLLGRRILETPELLERARLAEADVLGDPWDPAVMQGQIDELTALLDASTNEEPTFLMDADGHRRNVVRLGQIILASDAAFDAPPVCGNGVLERAQACAGECDDGNQVDGDGCNAGCGPEICGDGIVQPDLGEVCEWGTPDCNSRCNGFIVCGDGFPEIPEMCDDGNDEDEDGCSSACVLEGCGDGVVQHGLGEACDGERLCRVDCSGIIPCGDGLVEWPEYCDDGNQLDDDGCTNECESTCTTLTHGGWTYELCGARTPYSLSTAICAHVGGVPATPRSQEENDWLLAETQLVDPGPWWLGLQKIGQDWQGADGAPLRLAAWGPGEPDGEGECALLDPDPDAAGWNDASCDESHPVVCRH